MSVSKIISNSACLDLENEIQACKTNYDIFRILRLVCTEYHCDTFFVSEFPGQEIYNLSEIFIVTNFDPELIREFDLSTRNFFDDIFLKLRKSIKPYFTRIPQELSDVEEWEGGPHELQSSDISRSTTVFFPVFDRFGIKGIVGFSGFSDMDEDKIAKLNFLATGVFDKLTEIKVSTNNSKNKLSEREIQCLNWTAHGKTSYEIGVILDISLNTVNHYLNNASKKLNCVNKTHAVVKCMQNGIL